MGQYKENRRQILCPQVAYNLDKFYLHEHKKLFGNVCFENRPPPK